MDFLGVQSVDTVVDVQQHLIYWQGQRVYDALLGSAPHKDRDYYCIGSNFWKFYLIKTGFTICEPVSFLVKVF
jgi:hypothetical protein